MIKHWKQLVGVVAYGSYIPEGRPDSDEDVASFCLNVVMEIERKFPKIDLQQVGAIYVGSESFPYAVKPMVTLIAEQLNIFEVAGANLEFACKAGTAALRVAALEAGSGASKYALAIGADIAQAKLGDVLEKTIGAGAGGVVMGRKKDEVIAKLEWMGSVASDTPDFWRREGQDYPEHTGRFTGGPSYLKHTGTMVNRLLTTAKMRAEEFDWVVLHSPNMKFPDALAAKFGFKEEALVHRKLFPVVKNAYAGSAMIGLCYALEHAKPQQKILVVSYGSGAGSDGFIFQKL